MQNKIKHRVRTFKELYEKLKKEDFSMNQDCIDGSEYTDWLNKRFIESVDKEKENN